MRYLELGMDCCSSRKSNKKRVRGEEKHLGDDLNLSSPEVDPLPASSYDDRPYPSMEMQLSLSKIHPFLIIDHY